MRLNDLTPEQQKLIDPRDLAQLGLGAPLPQERQNPKRPRLERDEQKIFRNWLLLNDLPHCWHCTHRRSTAVRGVSDFWVGASGKSAWIEFKQLPIRISAEQIEFQQMLSQQGLGWHIVRSAEEAIEIVRGWQQSKGNYT